MSWSDRLDIEDINYMEKLRISYAQNLLVTSVSVRYLNSEDIPNIDTGLHEVGIPSNLAYQRLIGVLDDGIGDVFPSKSNNEDLSTLLMNAGILYMDNHQQLHPYQIIELAYVYGVDPSLDTDMIVSKIKKLQSLIFMEIKIHEIYYPTNEYKDLIEYLSDYSMI